MWWNSEVLNPGRGDRLPEVYVPDPREPLSLPAAFHNGSPAECGDAWQWWWQYARAQAQELMLGIAPSAIEVHGPVLHPDESALVETTLSYSRLYGGDGSYDRSDWMVLGRPTVMLAATAMNAAINYRRRAAARREARLRWRDEQSSVTVWATTHRIMCNTGAGMLSFSYGAVREFYPDLGGWSVVLGFGPECPALRLAGPAAPMIGLWVATAVLGDRWSDDPRLRMLVA